MSTAHDTAAYFIWRASEDGNLITHLKLQKLCYYAQGYALALMGEAMFAEPIEAWEHGPVVRVLYDEYKQFRRSPIPPGDEPAEIEPWRTRILEMVHQRFGWMSAWELRNRTHAEVPWRESWHSDEPNPELSNVVIRDFFRSTLRGERMHPPPVAKAKVLEMLKENDELRKAAAKGRSELRTGRGIPWSGRDGEII